MTSYRSWGRYPRARHTVHTLTWRTEDLPLDESAANLLPFGQGRSYGDSCLNDGGVLLATSGLNRFIEFDHEHGVLRCEAGVTFDEILKLTVPQGWFLPVTPGTRFVSLGGAIANDVHGKNHHRAGTFGRHVRKFELLRSDGQRRACSLKENPDWFKATIGGLGLTGLISWAEIQLKPIMNPFIRVETVPFPNIDAFFDIAARSENDYEYTVAWIDCLAKGKALGRGLFMRGNHAPAQPRSLPAVPSGRRLRIPWNAPGFALNQFTVRTFNCYYFHRPRRKNGLVHYLPFFYPLDAIEQWNRIYGKRGFLQYQCVVPYDDGGRAIKSLLGLIAQSGTGSFLSVLKTFGDLPSPGMLSFPRKGVTLALDFPHRGERTLALLERLDEITRESGGAVYPAKDARMSAQSFQTYYSQWRAFAAYVDPKFSSGFWRRATKPAAKEHYEKNSDYRRNLGDRPRNRQAVCR